MTNRTQIVSSAAQRIARKEVAAKLPEWLESMSPASRKAYLKAHPDSKYAGSLGGSGGSGDKVADKHNATIRQSAADAKDSRAQIKLLKSQLPESTETRADKAKATRINKKIQEQMEHLKSHKAAGDKAKALLEKRSAAKPAATKEDVGKKSIRRPPANSPLGRYIREANERHAKRMDKADEAQERLEKRSAAKPAATKEAVGKKSIRKAGRVLPKGLGADSSPGGSGKSSKNSDMGLKNPPAPTASKPKPEPTKPSLKSDPKSDKLQHDLMERIRNGDDSKHGAASNPADQLLRHIAKPAPGVEETEEHWDAYDDADSAITKHGIDSPQATKALTKLRSLYGKADPEKQRPAPKPAMHRDEDDEPRDSDESYRSSPKAAPIHPARGMGAKKGGMYKAAPGRSSAPSGRRPGKGGSSHAKPSAKSGGSPAKAPGRY